MGFMDGVLALAGALGDVLFSLPVPVLVILLFVILFLTLSSFSSITPEKLKSCPSGQAGSDPADPVVSFCRSLGAPDHPHEEAAFFPASDFIFGNASSSAHFVNQFAEGEFLSLHRATYDKELNKSGDYDYGSYFQGKKRLWEARIQFRWKKPPKVSDLYFGIELEEFVPMNRATKRVMETMVTMLKRVVGSQIYHSPGDDPKVVTSGELEKPVFVMPLWAFDQFIVTPEDQTPPNLTDPAISSMGSLRFKRVRKFKEELEKLEFRVGPTYTFCFWGISQWLDKLNWEIKVPFMSPLDFNLFCGRPPVHVVIYSMPRQQSEQDQDKKRKHLKSQKQYYFHTAFWSSKCRPSFDRIQALTRNTETMTSLEDSEGDSIAHPLVGNLTKRGGNAAWFACCSGR